MASWSPSSNQIWFGYFSPLKVILGAKVTNTTGDACILMFLRHGSGKGILKCENREMVEEFELQDGFMEFLNQVHGNLVLNCLKLKKIKA